MKHSKSKLTDALGITEEEFFACTEAAKISSMQNKVSHALAAIMDSFDIGENKGSVMFAFACYTLGQIHASQCIADGMVAAVEKKTQVDNAMEVSHATH